MLRKPDLDRARRDLAYFAKLVGTPLAKWQAESLGLESRVTYIIGARQSGKSRSVAVLAAWWAFREPDQHVLVISAGELGSKRLLAMVAQLVASSPLLAASVVDEQTGLLRLTNRSTVRSVAASSRAIRGWSIDLLILDEATELTDEIIDVALPTAAARPDARIVFASTGGAPVGRAYETYMAGLDPRSKTVRSFKWALRDARWISKAAIEHERNTMPPWRFQAEYLGEWAGSVDSLFPPDLLKRASADLDLPALDELRGPARLLGGVDWADTGPDQTAVVAIARVAARGEVEGPVFVAWPARVYEIGTEATAAAREIATSPARWRCLGWEAVGIGTAAGQVLRDELRRIDRADRHLFVHGGGHPLDFDAATRRINRIKVTWEVKADAYGTLKLLAERGQLVFARQEQFMRQLATIKVEHRQFSVGIEAPTGGHDDLADAAYIAATPYREEASGERRVLLGRLARRHLPEPTLPEPDEWIEAGDLLLPKRPDLISVDGAEVTPARRDRPDPADPWARIREQFHAARKRRREEAST
jgi:hypothetical protein